MKNSIVSALFATTLFVASVAHADDCRLERPIPFAGLLGHASMTLHDVRLSPDPRFPEASRYVPGRDELWLEVFVPQWDQREVGSIAARLRTAGSGPQSIGFSEHYSGNFAFNHLRRESNGSVSYTLTETASLPVAGGNGARRDAVTHSTIVTRGSEILAIELSAPVFRARKLEHGETFLDFSGEHQRLCVRSAR